MLGSRKISKIVGARLILPKQVEADRQVDISIDGSRIGKITPHEDISNEDFQKPDIVDARGCLVGPSLCHAHVHLDKCFLLSDPKFKHLEIVEGTFAEALELTAKAKQMFEEEDLLR